MCLILIHCRYSSRQTSYTKIDVKRESSRSTLTCDFFVNLYTSAQPVRNCHFSPSCIFQAWITKPTVTSLVYPCFRLYSPIGGLLSAKSIVFCGSTAVTNVWKPQFCIICLLDQPYFTNKIQRTQNRQSMAFCLSPFLGTPHGF